MNQNARTCDSCLGLGLARPKHHLCHGGTCSCCGTVPSTRVTRPKLKVERVRKPQAPRRKDPSQLLRHRVTERELAEASRLRTEGRSWREVGTALGRDYTSLRSAMKRAGMDLGAPAPSVPKSGPRARTEEAILDRARALRQKGLTWREVGGALGRDHSGLRRAIEPTPRTTGGTD